jgi:hypothetical protein
MWRSCVGRVGHRHEKGSSGLNRELSAVGRSGFIREL